MDKPVCYCFGYSEQDIEQDVIKSNGRSLILEKIRASKKDGTCRCHEKNPTGK
jgi:hypothetical protein